MTDSTPSNPTSSPQIEYQSLLSYFKYLVALSGIFVAVVVTVGGYMFHSNLKDVREDAKQEATRVATTEAKNRVTEAFEEKNINALILAAAKDKVGTITDTLYKPATNDQTRTSTAAHFAHRTNIRKRNANADGVSRRVRKIEKTPENHQ
jgi:H+/gluconate symporter-like permease